MWYYFSCSRYKFLLNRRWWILKKFVELGTISKNRGRRCENILEVRKNWYYLK